MSHTPHTTFTRGTRVRVKLRDGTVFIDKFRERKPKFIFLENHKLTVDMVSSITIYKK